MVGDGGDVRIVPADRKADNGSSDDAINVDLTRARLLADPAALWRHAYAEFGRLLRRDFWTSGCRASTDGVLGAYRFLLTGSASPEFVDLLYEVAAELRHLARLDRYPGGSPTARRARRGRGAARRRRLPRAPDGRGWWTAAARRVIRPARPFPVHRARRRRAGR